MVALLLMKDRQPSFLRNYLITKSHFYDGKANGNNIKYNHVGLRMLRIHALSEGKPQRWAIAMFMTTMHTHARNHTYDISNVKMEQRK